MHAGCLTSLSIKMYVKQRGTGDEKKSSAQERAKRDDEVTWSVVLFFFLPLFHLLQLPSFLHFLHYTFPLLHLRLSHPLCFLLASFHSASPPIIHTPPHSHIPPCLIPSHSPILFCLTTQVIKSLLLKPTATYKHARVGALYTPPQAYLGSNEYPDQPVPTRSTCSNQPA